MKNYTEAKVLYPLIFKPGSLSAFPNFKILANSFSFGQYFLDLISIWIFSKNCNSLNANLESHYILNWWY